MNMLPVDVLVEVGDLANFTCNVSCALDNTHTIQWFVGDSPNNWRLVDPKFEQRTGIQVIIQRISNCATTGQIMARQLLSVNITSVARLNRTAIQCAALKKGPSDLLTDMYSHYGVILVNGRLL